MTKESTTKTKGLTESSKKFLNKYLKLTSISRKKINRDNEQTIDSALLYEKFRVAVEYQEEHLIFKNAVSRIIHRKVVYSPNISCDRLVTDLINELAWTNYINPETLDEEVPRIKEIVIRYLTILRYARSAFYNKLEIQKRIINWLACEIDDTLSPRPERDQLINFAYEILNKNLRTDNAKISDSDNEIQLKIAIFNLVFKPDLPQIQLWIIDRIFPNWRNFTSEEAKKFALSFDPHNNLIEKNVNHPKRMRYLHYAKRNIAPFILIRNLPQIGTLEDGSPEEISDRLRSNLLDIYDSMIKSAKNKVWRATIRALIFILITKISLAILLEIPFDKFLSGEIHYTSLIINICLPPVLMLIMGNMVKSPPPRNRQQIDRNISSIFSENKIISKPFSLAPKKQTVADIIFDYAYFFFTISILGLVIWALVLLKFNILSILLFFIFISAVSFFSFRIRNIALELAIKSPKHDHVSTLIEFLLLPFTRIGKITSDRLSRSNPFTSGLDLLIEAPLKIIIKTANSWFGFVNRKKEEIEF